jgi:asparagine synthase (glutamine-hydrolysing)
MIQWHIMHQAYRHYAENGEGFVTGTAFLGNRMLQGEALLNHFLTWKTAEEWKEGLLNLNGFFAVVVKQGNQIFAAVDRLRSIPLFYGKQGSDIFIGDDARWVRGQLEEQEMDLLARREFLATGYVTGQDTLFPNLKQIQAGELVAFETSEHGHSDAFPQRYFRYVHSDYSDSPEETLHLWLQETLDEVFGRLIALADGRPIVVPLSGGYDSRLIVLMLKKLGYENVVAFSYGKPGNKESAVSRQVADSLGIRWEFVPYSSKLWYHWYRTSEMQEYCRFADGLSSLPHIQDWPAVLALTREGRVPADSIFVPGHSADLLAGSRSKSVPDLYTGQVNESRLVKAILGYHYSLFPWQKEDPNLERFFEERVRRSLGDPSQYPAPASAFESWDISERQPKFIVNSLRVYEFFGYEWWMPFWDKSFMDFWQKISPELRIDEALHIENTNKLSKYFSIDINRNASDIPTIQGWITTLAKKLLPYNFKQHLRSQRHIKYFPNHPLQWYGLHDSTSVSKSIRNGAISINSILAEDTIGYLEGKKEG